MIITSFPFFTVQKKGGETCRSFGFVLIGHATKDVENLWTHWFAAPFILNYFSPWTRAMSTLHDTPKAVFYQFHLSNSRQKGHCHMLQNHDFSVDSPLSKYQKQHRSHTPSHKATSLLFVLGKITHCGFDVLESPNAYKQLQWQSAERHCAKLCLSLGHREFLGSFFPSLIKRWPEHLTPAGYTWGVTKIIYSVAALSLLKFASDFLPMGLGAVVSCFPGFWLWIQETKRHLLWPFSGFLSRQQQPQPALPALQQPLHSSASHQTTCGWQNVSRAKILLPLRVYLSLSSLIMFPCWA